MKPSKAQAEVTLVSREPATVVALEAGAKAKTRPFKMDPAYSGAVFDHPYFGRAVIDVAGLRVPEEGVPAYRQHDPGQFVGRSAKVELADGRVSIQGFLFEGVAAADEVALISDQGGKWQASIKADPNLDAIDYVGADSTVTVNGVQIEGPLAVMRESYLREASFVPRGADTDTTALALSHQTTKEKPPMDPIVAERARMKAIREAFPKHQTFALEQIDKGATLQEARAEFSTVLQAELEEKDKASTAALAAEKTKVDAAEKKAADAAKQAAKPSHAAQLGASSTGTSAATGGADAEPSAIKRWDVALAAETERLKGSDEIDAMALRRGIALSDGANLRALAVSNLSERDPALREAMVAEFNASGVGSRARNNKAR